MCKFEMCVYLHIHSFDLNFHYMATCILQCSPTSVVLAQARPNRHINLKVYYQQTYYIAISFCYYHPFHHTGWLDSTRTSQHQRPSEGG